MNRISFLDIMTRGIIYYDSEYHEACKDFCKIRNIKYLPHINSGTFCFHYDAATDQFERRTLLEDQVVDAHHNVYDNHLIECFQKYEILFVRDLDRICGITHYSDYNRSPVYEDLYKKLFLLERGLVHLIIEYSGLNRGDLMNYVGIKLPENQKADKLSYKDFSGKGISLMTILQFVFDLQLVKIRKADIFKITTIRNIIAHSDNLVASPQGETMSFKMKSFKQLILGANSLDVALKQVGNRLYFMKASLQDDFSIPVIPIEDYLFK